MADLSQHWPTQRAKRALLYVSLLCATVVVGLGFHVKDTAASFSTKPHVVHRFLGVPIDSMPLSVIQQDKTRLLVIFGEPPVFAAAIIVLSAIALAARDRRLAFIAVVAPVTAELLTEMVAKPYFHRVSGEYFAYPSGHVTACVSIMAVLAVAIRRISSRRIALISAPFLTLVCIGSMIGVVVLHMHDWLDAIGGAAMAIGVVSFWTAIATESTAKPTFRQNR